MRSKKDEYMNLLDRYDKKFLFLGIKNDYEGILKQNDNILELNEPYKVNETMIKYRRAPDEGCKECKDIFEKVIKLQEMIFNYLQKNPKEAKKEVMNFVIKEFPDIKDSDSDFNMVYGNIQNIIKKYEEKNKTPPPPNTNITFHNRPMEFPGFYKSLDFSQEHIKDIMIIGEAAGPGILTNINCTYGLSNTEFDENGEILLENILNKLKDSSKNLSESFDLLEIKGKKLEDQVKSFGDSLKHKLWKRLKNILPISLEELKKKVYITDLVKWNAKGNSIWKHFREKCFESFLIHEIRIINPKLIIFLGNTGYYFLKNKKKFKFDEFSPTTKDGKRISSNDIPNNHPEYSKYVDYNFRNDKYLKKYYEKVTSKSKNNKSFAELKLEDKEKLRKKLPRYFPIFGELSFKHDLTRSTITKIKFVKIFHNSNQNKSLWKVYTEAYKEFLNILVDEEEIVF